MSVIGWGVKTTTEHVLTAHAAKSGASKALKKSGNAAGSSSGTAETVARRVTTTSARRAAALEDYAAAFGGAEPPPSWSAKRIAEAVKGGTVKNMRAQAIARGVPGARGMSRADLVTALYRNSNNTTIVAKGQSFLSRVGNAVSGAPLSNIAMASTITQGVNEFRDGYTPVDGLGSAAWRVGANIGIHAAARAAEFVGVNKGLVGAAELGGTLIASGLTGMAKDYNRLRGFGRGVLQAIDVSGFVGRPVAVDWYNEKFGGPNRNAFDRSVVDPVKDAVKKANGNKPIDGGTSEAAKPSAEDVRGLPPSRSRNAARERIGLPPLPSPAPAPSNVRPQSMLAPPTSAGSSGLKAAVTAGLRADAYQHRASATAAAPSGPLERMSYVRVRDQMPIQGTKREIEKWRRQTINV